MRSAPYFRLSRSRTCRWTDFEAASRRHFRSGSISRLSASTQHSLPPGIRQNRVRAEDPQEHDGSRGTHRRHRSNPIRSRCHFPHPSGNNTHCCSPIMQPSNSVPPKHIHGLPRALPAHRSLPNASESSSPPKNTTPYIPEPFLPQPCRRSHDHPQRTSEVR